MMRPIATPATGALIGTPASIIASEPPHTEAIEEMPFDLEDVGDDADGVGELVFGRHHRRERALGEGAVADLAAAGAAQELHFTDREGREVVVQHEALPGLALDHLDLLLVVGGAERGGDERLRLAAGEHGRAVRRGAARSVSIADRDGSRRTCGRRGARCARGSRRAAPSPAGLEDALGLALAGSPRPRGARRWVRPRPCRPCRSSRACP